MSNEGYIEETAFENIAELGEPTNKVENNAPTPEDLTAYGEAYLAVWGKDNFPAQSPEEATERKTAYDEGYATLMQAQKIGGIEQEAIKTEALKIALERAQQAQMQIDQIQADRIAEGLPVAQLGGSELADLQKHVSLATRVGVNIADIRNYPKEQEQTQE